MSNGAEANGSNGKNVRTPVPPLVQMELGQVSVTPAIAGRLAVYDKSDGRKGCTFYDEANRKYGVARGVFSRFTETGEVQGWGFCAPEHSLVFLFIKADDGQPSDLVSIRVGDEFIRVARKVQMAMTLRQGTWVAFHAIEKQNGNPDRPVRVAIQVFPLTLKHPDRLRQLLDAGRLNQTAYVGFLQDLVKEVARESDHGRVNQTEVLADVLRKIAALEVAPPQLKIDARTECTRLGLGPGAGPDRHEDDEDEGEGLQVVTPRPKPRTPGVVKARLLLD